MIALWCSRNRRDWLCLWHGKRVPDDTLARLGIPTPRLLEARTALLAGETIGIRTATGVRYLELRKVVL